MKKDVAMQLKGTYQKISQVMQVKIDEYDLTFGLLLIISLIEKNPDASQKDIAKEMKFTQGAMSLAMRRLLKLGMVTQIPLKSDMRCNRLALTEKGRSALDDYKGYLSKVHEDMFSEFSYEDIIKLNSFLSKINDNLDSIKKQNNL